MPCNHKFQKDLDLQRLDFAPATLIVGTFNPEWPASNTAKWFYGRTQESFFWDILPRLYGAPSLINATPADWKQFCHNKQIAITDLISVIEDAMPGNKAHQRMLGGFSDDAIIHNFEDFSYIDIVQILRHHPTIKQVYFTRAVTDVFWRYLWTPIAHYCSQNHIHERKLLTPSPTAAFHHEEYNHEHPKDSIPGLADYLLMRWQKEWHF